MSTGNKRKNENADEAYCPKRLLLADPDVKVIVGGETFLHYSMVLCYSSEYFDVMLSSNMKEGNTKVIEFPHKDPKEWRKVCKFFEPAAITEIKYEKDLSMIVPWFHELRMIRGLKYCDKVLRQYLLTRMRLFEKNNSETKRLHNGAVKRLKAILEKTEFCILYDLAESTDECLSIWKLVLEEKYRLLEQEESVAHLLSIIKNNEKFRDRLLPSVRKLVPTGSFTPETSADEILSSPRLPGMIVLTAKSNRYKVVQKPHVEPIDFDDLSEVRVKFRA